MPGLEDLTTDQLLARARQTEQSHSLLQTLSQNPETRELLQRALKKANPTLAIPELDTREAIDAALKTEREERLKLEAQLREDQIRRRIEEDRRSVAQEFNLSADDMKAVEAIMVREVDPIPSYRAAAQVYKASTRPATPTPAAWTAPTTYDMPEKDVWGKGIGNKAMLNKIAMDEAFKAFGEIRSGKVAA